VFDDVGAVPMSQYDYNVLYALIDSRVFAKLPSIYTTNATSKEEMSKIVGPRLADRIWNADTIIEFKSNGIRGKR
jgi:DNA replication protein DnaC